MFAAKRVFGYPLRFPPSTTLTDWLWAVAFSNATCTITLPLPSREALILSLSEQVPPLVAHMKGIEPSSFRLTTGCSTIELHMQVVRMHGVEPWLRVYQTRVLTIELHPSGSSGNRTLLGQFAKLACHLNSPQKPSRIRTDPAALQAASSPRGSGPRGWTSRNRTEQAASRRRGYSPACVPAPIQRKKVESNHRALPRTPLAGEVAATGHIFQAESKGIEPSALRLAQFSRLLGDRSPLPSKATCPRFELGPRGSEPLVLPLHQQVLSTPPRNRTLSKRFGISCATSTPATYGSTGIRTQVFRL